MGAGLCRRTCGQIGIAAAAAGTRFPSGTAASLEPVDIAATAARTAASFAFVAIVAAAASTAALGISIAAARSLAVTAASSAASSAVGIAAAAIVAIAAGGTAAPADAMVLAAKYPGMGVLNCRMQKFRGILQWLPRSAQQFAP